LDLRPSTPGSEGEVENGVVELFIPDPSFEPEKIEYIDGFGARIVWVFDDDEDDDAGGWFSWKRPEVRSVFERLRWEDEGNSWF
jgi:hypothetical protein